MIALSIAIAYLGTLAVAFLAWRAHRMDTTSDPEVTLDPVAVQEAMDSIGETLKKHENKLQTLMTVHALKSAKESRA